MPRPLPPPPATSAAQRQLLACGLAPPAAPPHSPEPAHPRGEVRAHDRHDPDQQRRKRRVARQEDAPEPKEQHAIYNGGDHHKGGRDADGCGRGERGAARVGVGRAWCAERAACWCGEPAFAGCQPPSGGAAGWDGRVCMLPLQDSSGGNATKLKPKLALYSRWCGGLKRWKPAAMRSHTVPGACSCTRCCAPMLLPASAPAPATAG